MLTDKEVLHLERVLVRDNESVEGIALEGGEKWRLSVLDGTALSYFPIFIDAAARVAIAAAVEDIVYVIVADGARHRVVHLRLFEPLVFSAADAVRSLWPFSERTVELTVKGGIYRGTVVRGLPEGKGILTLSADAHGRERIDATFRGGVPEGKGEIVYADGARYTGEILGGLPEGRGEWHSSDGTYYKGYFEEGKRHGSGTVFDKNGKAVCGGWWWHDILTSGEEGGK